MPATIGRLVTFTWSASGTASAIAGVREKSITFNGEPIDVSADDSSGWRELLDAAGERSVDIGLSGVTKSPVLRNAFMGSDRTGTGTLTYPDGAIVTGSFVLGDYKEGAPYKDAVTFEGTLKSTGAITYTAGT